MRLVIVSGMSGAGKTIALKAMEDMGFYCVDNMPIFLIEKFVQILTESNEPDRMVAIVADIRSGKELPGLKDVLCAWDKDHVPHEILFLDASDRTLLKRFKETRRCHPLSRNGSLEEGIAAERSALSWLRERAVYVLDTSGMLTRDLRNQLEEIFFKGTAFGNLYLTVMSFGFKYGIPEDADLVFDVRFLPNPFYEDELKAKSGLDKEVRDFVMQSPDGDAFLSKLEDMLDFLIPRYMHEGRNQLVIAFGCTGGRHRSVTLAEAVYGHLKGRGSYGIRIDHRDINRS